MHFDKDVYFDAVRDELFSGALTQQQVDGQTIILSVFEYQGGGTPMTDIRWLAYMLATVHHETAEQFWPIEEYGKGSGRDYGVPDPETGETYYGRGFVQLTWKANYQTASHALALIGGRDLVQHAHMALDSLIATRIMFRGMAEGWFTGKKLGQYFNDEDNDPVNARQIINGNDQDTLIASYHDKFLEALELAVEQTIPTEAGTPVIVNLQTPPGVGVVVHLNGEELTA